MPIKTEKRLITIYLYFTLIEVTSKHLNTSLSIGNTLIRLLSCWRFIVSLTLFPQTGQYWCLIPSRALHLEQDTFIILLRCNIVTVFCSKSTSLTLSASASDILQPKRESSLISSLSCWDFATSSISAISQSSIYAFIFRRFQRTIDSSLGLEVSSLHGVPANIFTRQLAVYFSHSRPAEILTNSSLQGVRDWLLARFQLLAVISLPHEAFQHAGAGVKASIVFVRKRAENEVPDDDEAIFMAAPANIGYDATGRKTPRITVKDEDRKSKVEIHATDLFETEVTFDKALTVDTGVEEWQERTRRVLANTGVLGKYRAFERKLESFFV